MSDYTPTTEEIQSRYVYAADFTVSEEVDAWGEFDRWLAAHDAEVRRVAFVEIVNGVNLIDVCEKDAYRRGREDAAKAALNELIESRCCQVCDNTQANVYAAARGDGE